MKQKTILNVFKIEGIGLHSGRNISMTVKPAPTDTGIVFIREDLSSKPKIKASYSSVVSTDFCTVLANKKGVRISTVEHFLSAVYALNITNLIVEVNAPELPILDGSSNMFLSDLINAKIVEQDKNLKYLQVFKTISYRVDDRFIYLLPSSSFKLTCRVNFTHPSIGIQHIEYKDDLSFYVKDISKAKTFGFLDEVNKLKSRGLISGASYKNALVLNENEVVNNNLMSYENEFVRHKVLDILGDLSLIGNYKLLAHVVAYKSGHKLHNEVIKELFKNKNSFKILEEPAYIDERLATKELLDILSPVGSF